MTTTIATVVTATGIKGKEIGAKPATTESAALFAADIAIDWVTAIILYRFSKQ
jgi:hypothetical protein